MGGPVRGRTRHASTFLVVVGLLSHVAGHRPFLAQQQPTFHTGVDVVPIDVNVVDRDGPLFDDLKPHDLIVTVDRKPR